MNETTCINCGIYPSGNIEEANVCMLCGGTLCEHCYDDSSYCRSCQNAEEDKQVLQGGECVECGRTVTALNSAGVCEGCVIDAQAQ